MNDFGHRTRYWLGDNHLLHSGTFWVAPNLCPESDQLIRVAHYRSTVNGGQTRNGIHSPA